MPKETSKLAPTTSKLLWFGALYLGGVAVVSGTAYLIRLWIA